MWWRKRKVKFRIEAVCISERKGTPKHAVAEGLLLEERGIDKDAHAGSGHRQVSLLAGEQIDEMRAKGLTLAPGAFGENLVTRGVDWRQAQIGERLVIGDIEMEITQIGKECHHRCAIYDAAGECIMPRCGVFARVIRGGIVHADDCGDYRIGPRP
jgi:molybdopterin adenylyltransferase